MSRNVPGRATGPFSAEDHSRGVVTSNAQSVLRPRQSNSTLADTIRALREVNHSSSSTNTISQPPRSDLGLGNRRKRPTPLKDSSSSSSKLYGNSQDGTSLYSPLSPTFSPLSLHEGQRSPRERLEALLKSESPQDRTFTSPVPGLYSGQLASKFPEAPSDAPLRNISAPVLHTLPSLGPSPPTSPLNMLPSRVEPRPVMPPRNASIDSAVSSISSSASQSTRSAPAHGYKSSQDSAVTPPTDIAGLIAAAGSAEAALHKLWKEKQSADSHNAQLWRLMEKQRAMTLGLNRDLEKAMKDKDRYRKKLKDLAAQRPAAVSLRNDSALDREQSQSPAPIEELDERRQTAKTVTSRKAVPVASSSHGLREQLGRDLVAAPNNNSSDAVSFTSSTGGNTSLEVSPVTATSGHADGSQERPLSPPEEDTGLAFPSPKQIQMEPSPRTPPKPLSQRQIIPTLSPPESPPSPQKFTPPNAPTVAITQATPVANSGSFSPRNKPAMVRKTAPAPLNLSQSTIHPSMVPAIESGFDSPVKTVVQRDVDDFERGRRKTREDDDRIREAVAIAQEEARSMSKQSKKSKSKSKPPTEHPQILEPQGSNTARTLTPLGLPPSPRPNQTTIPRGALLSPAGSESSISSTTAQRSYMSPPLLSPGLPMSPRPMDRPANAPSPRQQQSSFPNQPSNHSSVLLNENHIPPSPRAPSASTQPSAPHAQPRAFHISSPSAVPPPLFARSISAQTISSTVSDPSKMDPDRLTPASDRPSTSSTLSPVEGVYRGLISEQYPGLLLPPNAIPSIDIKVFSSRLRPSRHSMLLANPNEEDPVFLLGIYSRSNGQQLWRVEKTIMALPTLHQQIKSFNAFDGRLPEKGLFSGHAPAKIDARRAALNAYFDMLLDTQLNEKAALVVCDFFSTNVIGADSDLLQVRTESPAGAPPTIVESGPPHREGYLTKRGKNFGGWKARFFVLDGPELKYFDSPGGPQIGVIKLIKAQIGKQAHQQSNHSPMGRDDEAENQYRHAFLVLEPKRKDSSSLVRHVLCAESDEERDAWVKALMAYVDFADESQQQEQQAVQLPRAADMHHTYNPPAQVRDAREVSSRQQPATRPPPSRGAQTPEPDPSLTLQGMSYEQTVAGETPVRGPTVSTYRGGGMQGMPSPSLNGNFGFPQQKQSFNISAPSNGSVIQDVGMWGNKTPAKEKKRSIFGFRGRATSDTAQSAMIPPERKVPQGRPIFGMPLAEAVECSQPVGVDVYLPAVVYRCIEYLEARSAINEEGIFRLSGSQNLIKALRERFNNDGDVRLLDGEYYDVHAVASLLKLYLRELPSSVLTREHHIDFLKVLDVEDKSKRVAAFNVLVHQLPMANLELLSNLCSYLADIANSADVNKMNVRNVAIVFAPTLNIPAPLIQLFLTDFPGIFGEPIEEHKSPIREITLSLPPPSDGIRSPRHQFHSDLPTPAYTQTGFGQQAMPGFQPLGASTNPNRNTYTPTRQPDNGYMAPPAFNLPQGGPDPYNSLSGPSQPTSKKGRRESSMMGLNVGLMNQRQTSRLTLRDTSNSRIPEQAPTYAEQQRDRGSPERQQQAPVTHF